MVFLRRDYFNLIFSLLSMKTWSSLFCSALKSLVFPTAPQLPRRDEGLQNQRALSMLSHMSFRDVTVRMRHLYFSVPLLATEVSFLLTVLPELCSTEVALLCFLRAFCTLGTKLKISLIIRGCIL